MKIADPIRRTSRLLGFGLAVLLLTSISVASAQRPSGPPSGHRGPPGQRGMGFGQGEDNAELHETVQLFFLHKMRDLLALDQRQTMELMDIMDQRREKSLALREQHHKAVQNLTSIVEQDNATDAEYRAAVQDWEDTEKKIRSLDDEFRSREDAILTPKQQAMRRVLEPQIHKEIQGRVRQIQKMDRSGSQQGQGPSRNQNGLKRLREADPELFKRLQEKRQNGEELTQEEREAVRKFAVEERRRQMRNQRPGGNRQDF